MSQIQNPILPGFNPDPAICRKGEDIYIATSTFEWWPGVQIHHSRDLVHWRLLCRPLSRPEQLDLRGVEDSGGVWAPCLSYAHERFWLVYTNVQNKQGAFFDTPNYVVWAEDIEGPWSDPVALTRTGFDPSFFHDEDGRSWLTSMRWNHLPGSTKFDRIVLQEYDREEQKLIGPEYEIFHKAIGGTEGPHLLKRGDWYYLILAEGGTGWHHAITVARSKELMGPYEVHPENPILTSHGDPENPLQKSGHGGFVELPDGSWWTTHLCARPLPGTELNGKAGTGRCLLGRETGIQPLIWSEDDWPRLAHGGRFPRQQHQAPALPPCPWPDEQKAFDFLDGQIPDCLQSPRLPIDASWVEVEPDPGYLRMQGGGSPLNRFTQHLLARRITHWVTAAEVELDALPRHFQHEAGLRALYDSECWYQLGVTWDRDQATSESSAPGARVLRLSSMEDRNYAVDRDSQVRLKPGAVSLRFVIDHQVLTAWWRQADSDWQQMGPELDASKLSDEFGNNSSLNFTGSWYGIFAMDLCGDGFYADFKQLSFRDGPPEPTAYAEDPQN